MTPYSPRRRFEPVRQFFMFASVYILDFIFNFSSTMTFGNDLRRCAFAETSKTPQQHAPVIRHLTHHVLQFVYLLDCSHVVPSRGPHNPRWEYWELHMSVTVCVSGRRVGIKRSFYQSSFPRRSAEVSVPDCPYTPTSKFT